MSDDVLERLKKKRYALSNAETFLREMREIRDDLSERGVYSIAYGEEFKGGIVKVSITAKVPDGAAVPTGVFDRHEWDTAKLIADRDPKVIELRAGFSTVVNGRSRRRTPGHPCEAA